MTQDHESKRKLVIAGHVLGGTVGGVIAIFSALIGLGICVVCVLLFPIGLLGFPFAIGFFLPLLVWIGAVGGLAQHGNAKQIAEKVLRGETVPEEAAFKAVDNLMNSKNAQDQRLGIMVRDELEKRIVNTSKNS